MSANREIGAYEAKTTLPELLRKVQKGERFTITNRGEPVAELVPIGSVDANRVSAAAQAMLAIMIEATNDKSSSPTKKQLKEWVDEGRK